MGWLCISTKWKEVVGDRKTYQSHVHSVMHNLGGLPLHLFNELHEGLLELGRHR